MTDTLQEEPLLIAEGLSKSYGRQLGCRDVSFELYEGEAMAVVGESGSGKTTLLNLLSTQIAPTAGRVLYRMRDGVTRDLAALGEAECRLLARTDWGFVHQDPESLLDGDPQLDEVERVEAEGVLDALGERRVERDDRHAVEDELRQARYL